MDYFEMQNTIRGWINNLEEEIEELNANDDLTPGLIKVCRQNRQELIDMLEDVCNYCMGMPQ